MPLIIGGANGLGPYTANLFVKHGGKVIVTYVEYQLGCFVRKEIGPK